MTAPSTASSRRPERSVLGRVRHSYPRLRHILVPIDFSGKSRQALRYAIPFAQKFLARIHLVHVLQPADKVPPAELTRLRQEALKRLAQLSVQHLPPLQRGESAVLAGRPAEQILSVAEKNDIDLIVLATPGRSGLKRALPGSTAEHIMRQAKCPVMSLRQH